MRSMELTRPQFASVRGILYKDSGVYITEAQLPALVEKIQDRVQELRLPDLSAYVRYLDSGVHREEVRALIEVSTANLRATNPPRFQALCRSLLEDILRSRKKEGVRRLRLWSATCRTGEEPFSLAIALRERLGDAFPAWDISIRGTDPSPKAMVRARAGIYTDESIPQLSAHSMLTFAEPRGKGRWQLDAALRDGVQFEQRGLLGASGDVCDADLILCRHGLADVSSPDKVKVLDEFHHALRVGGWLVLGAQESLQRLHTGFRLVLFNDGIAYQKSCPSNMDDSSLPPIAPHPT